MSGSKWSGRQCARGRVSVAGGVGESEREGEWERVEKKTVRERVSGSGWSGRQCARKRVSDSGWSGRQCVRGLVGEGGAEDSAREGEWERVERETVREWEGEWQRVERETVREWEGDW